MPLIEEEKVQNFRKVCHFAIDFQKFRFLLSQLQDTIEKICWDPMICDSQNPCNEEISRRIICDDPDGAVKLKKFK